MDDECDANVVTRKHDWGLVLDEHNIVWKHCRLCMQRRLPGDDERTSITPVAPQNLVEGEKVVLHFVAEQEPMGIYQLEDGSVLKNKSILMHAERVVGKYNQDGTPFYNVSFQQVLHVLAPDHLKRKP